MAVWIQEDAKVLVQGITGKQGKFHADKMMSDGSQECNQEETHGSRNR